MRPQDLVVVDMQGHKLVGRRSVSSEIAMHLLIYKMRTEVNAQSMPTRRSPLGMLQQEFPLILHSSAKRSSA